MHTPSRNRHQSAGALIWAALAACLGASVADGQLSPPPAPRLDLAAYEPQLIEVPEAGRGAIRVSLRLEGAPIDLDLQPSSVRGPGFRVLVDGGDGPLVEHAPPDATTYRGVARSGPGRPADGARVAASVIDGGLRAVIVRGERRWYVQPLRDIDPRADARGHAVYRGTDVRAPEWLCLTDDAVAARDKMIDAADSNDATAGATAAGGCIDIAQIAFDADVEFFQSRGSDVGSTVADIESIVNAMNVIYERDVQISHVITAIIVRTVEPDPYTSTNASSLKEEFRSEWNASHSASSADPITRDLAHLMTGKVLDGSVGGIAAVGVVCSTNDAYAVSRSSFTSNFGVRVGLTAHEVGHNWNAGHCDSDADCAIMCSYLGGCNTLDHFGARAINAIISHRDSRSCLDVGSTSGNDCNFNCIDDAVELADGTAPDCNANGVIDACDVSGGTSGDCDGNAVPDECEDCDGNGLADACDLASTISFNSPMLSPIGEGAPGQYTFPEPPARLGDVTLEIEAVADLASGNRFIEVFLNGASVGIVFDGVNGTGKRCPATPDVARLVVPRAVFDELVGTGDASFTLAAPSSNPSACEATHAILAVSYDTFNDRDRDGNGVLDACECHPDCGASGPDAEVNVDDLLDLLADWGAAGGCDIAPAGGDGVIGIDDLLALLGSWGACAP